MTLGQHVEFHPVSCESQPTSYHKNKTQRSRTQQLCVRRFWKMLESSNRFQKILEGSRRCQKFQEALAHSYVWVMFASVFSPIKQSDKSNRAPRGPIQSSSQETGWSFPQAPNISPLCPLHTILTTKNHMSAPWEAEAGELHAQAQPRQLSYQVRFCLKKGKILK